MFENKTENKLIYTDIFKQYTTLIGGYPSSRIARVNRPTKVVVQRTSWSGG